MISVPLMNGLSTAENRPKYVRLLQEAGAGRVFLYLYDCFGEEEELSEIQKTLRENISFFEAAGFEVGVWINSLSQGGPIAHEMRNRIGDFTHICGLGGGEDNDTLCPLDIRFLTSYKSVIRMVSEAGAKIIMFDDDLRLSMHGPVMIGCACPLHLAEFNHRAQKEGLAEHEYTREELATFLLVGKSTPLRSVWLDLMGDTMKDFCTAMRKTVDEVDPTIRMGHCACLSTWDTDGVDSFTLARILAGNTKPFLRFIGAPYWTDGRPYGTAMGLSSIVDLERMQAAWRDEYAPDIEIMSEGDVYPRPRYKVPSSYLEAFHQALTADRFPDILKYMLDYYHDPDYETGYIRRHSAAKNLRDNISEAFQDTAPAGVYVFETMRKLADMDCTGYVEWPLSYRLMPSAVNFTEAMGVPVSFIRSPFTKVAVIAGENAKYASDNLCRMPLVLDAKAALILTDRGFDIGLRTSVQMNKPESERFSDGRAIPVDTDGRFYRLTAVKEAAADSYYSDGSPAVYRYERSDGGPVIVYAFDFDTVSMSSVMIRNYCRQEQFFRLLPVQLIQMKKEPGAYLITRKTDDKLVVGIWNFGTDMLLPESILLDGVYRSVSGIGTTKAALDLDGESVILEDMIPPYCFAGFVADRKEDGLFCAAK